MSASKHFDKFACVVTAVMLVITILFANGSALGIVSAETVLGYETRLFDQTKVHTIDIVMDDWDSFIETATSEEYSMANLVIDGETYKNVGIRGKGNTSLSTVASMDSDRYSFKIEFDQYDSTLSYYGLDKLCLNNLIQDATMMKDYLTYTMMARFGVNTPLCSFVYITVNGEDWGLYLAVEGVEDGFLTRNYGSDHGNLYKPDSMSFGGGRGNGKDFDMGDFDFTNMGNMDFGGNMQDMGSMPDMGSVPEMPDMQNGMGGDGTQTMPQMSGNAQGGMPAGNDQNGMPDMGAMPDNMPGMGEGQNGASDMGSVPDNMPGMGEMPGASMNKPEENPMDGGASQGFGFGGMGFSIDEATIRDIFAELDLDTSLLEGIDWDNITMNDLQSLMGKLDSDTLQKLMDAVMNSEVMDNFDFGGMGGMGSDDVKLQYIDDNYDSYSNIFDSAKTNITDKDKDRLIASLKDLSNYTNIEDVVDIDQVLRYFVVHNYVVNGDSYTGSMIHNYYLYEEDGKLAMIPWDYNLAFGTFQGGNAQSTVNEPIDSPVSDADDRPMWGWILSDAEYTELYHAYFTEFLTTVDVQTIIDEAYDRIKAYVEKDPTKFYSYEEFEAGVATLKQFCILRSDSITQQIENGNTIETMQYADASGISLSDMGTMNMGGGMGGEVPDMPMQEPSADMSISGEPTEESSDNDQRKEEAITKPSENGQKDGMGKQDNNRKDFGDFPGDFGSGTNTGKQNTTWVWLVVSLVVLAAGLIVAKVYRK